MREQTDEQTEKTDRWGKAIKLFLMSFFTQDPNADNSLQHAVTEWFLRISSAAGDFDQLQSSQQHTIILLTG